MIRQRCRDCPAEIVWATTALGKRMPVDADPHPEGNVRLIPQPGAAPTAVTLRIDDLRSALAAGAELYRSHFVTCPNRRRPPPALTERLPECP